MSNPDDEYISPEASGLAALVTATETPIAPVPSAGVVAPVPPSSHPTPGTGAVSVPMPDGWTVHTVATLVGDVACNMYDLPYILKKHKLTRQQYDVLEKNPFFQRALEAEIITWQGANSIQKRLALESAIAVETAMPVVAARMSNKGEPLGDIVALMKLFSEMAGVTGNKANPASMGTADRVRITINLGGTDTMQKDASVVIDQQAIAAS